MEPIEIFHIVHHSIELVFSILILYATFFAIKKFRLVIWRKGWYVLGTGALIFIIVEVLELLETLNYVKEGPLSIILIHSIHIIAFPLFAVGIFILSRSVGKVLGK